MSPRLRAAFARLVALCSFVFLGALQAPAQQPASPSRPAEPPASSAAADPAPKASEKYKNLKLLGDIPASQLHEAMVFMEASLGFNCGSCHVRKDGQFVFESDDNENKTTARRMIELTRRVNADYFKGQQEVSCATCHQGRRGPVGLPPVAQPFTPDQLAMQSAQAALPPGTRPPAPKETSDEVFAKYYDAIGGEAALQKTTSAVMRGTLTNRSGASSPAVVTEKAPDRYRLAIEGKMPTSRVFDGTKAWSRFGDNARDIEGVEALAVGREASPWLGGQLKTSLSRVQGGRYERIDGHDVITLSGMVSPDVQESLSFDRTSWLLLRRVIRLRTVMGRLQKQIDYADYRPVEGLKVPFQVTVSDWDAVNVLKFTDVKLNAPVDDTAFAK